MKYGELIIEKKEYDLLRRIMAMARYYKDDSYKTSIEKLNRELKRANIVHKREMPDDVVRFNSTVTINTAFDAKRSYQIVTPEKSNITLNKISVLAPMGLALFGYAQDDEILWMFPAGESYIKILNVNQLELV